jgi:hypothetical protein
MLFDAQLSYARVEADDTERYQVIGSLPTSRGADKIFP